jgi:hypothetical protein
MVSRADASVLTVLLAPGRPVEEILAVLADYSAVGMLDPYVCIHDADVGPASVPATVITSGRAEPVLLQQLLTGQRYSRVRVVVLVPVTAAHARTPLALEQAVEQLVRTASMGAPITLLRLLLSGAGNPSTPDDSGLVLEGWHNLVIAAEDSPGPELGAALLDRHTDPLEVARHVAPVVAGVAGLWAGIDSTPFDRLDVLPGQTVRVVRGFYRRLDTADIENRLRAELFSPTGRLPLPHGGQIQVVYADDPALAAQTMARALWTKHRDVLRGPRLPLKTAPEHAISIWSAVKMFLRFIAAALRRAPSAWFSAMIGSVSAAVASTVQSAVFGRDDSAFAVVASPELAGWQELARSAEEMSIALDDGSAQQQARSDLGPLWTDFVNGALTLADGGRRSTGLEPVKVGAGVGVLQRCADVIPGAAERFSAIPASLAAVIETSSVDAVDVLGVASLRDRLHRTYADPAAGVEARHAGADLDRWQSTVATSYGWQVAEILADFVNRARGDVTDLVDRIRAAAGEVSTDERLRRRQRTIALILKTFSWAVAGVAVTLAAAATMHWVRWPFALTCAGMLIAVYVVVTAMLFVVIQRDLFATLNLQESQIGQLEAMQTNLQAALTDLRRLSMAYGQFLAWSRAVGAVLRAPFGVLHAAVPPEPMLTGLPRSTAVAAAAPRPESADTAVRRIQQRLFGMGWLTQPWEALLNAARGESGDGSQSLLSMPGTGSGSALDRWSGALASGRATGGGADALWQQAQRIFTDPASGIGATLTGTVVRVDGTPVPADQFSAGMTQPRRGRPAPFDASLFTDAALTAGRAAVLVDEPIVRPRGLGYTAAVIQASDGLPTYDFALFAPAAGSPQGAGEHSTTVSPPDRDVPPGDLVF